MGPQYTTCVNEADFKPLNVDYLIGLGLILAGGLVASTYTLGITLAASVLAFAEVWRYLLNWLVHGKLICLYRNAADSDCVCGPAGNNTVCAIGEIVDTEHVGEDKNPIEDVDDDYSINLLLHPFDMQKFAAIAHVKSDDDGFPAHKQAVMALVTAPSQPQGDLLRSVVAPEGKTGIVYTILSGLAGLVGITGPDPGFGYLRTVVRWQANGQYFPLNEIVGRDSGTPGDAPDVAENWLDYLVENGAMDPKKVSVAVLHCEFEGSRSADMLEVLEGFPFGSSFCKSNIFTKALCKALSTLLAPILAVLFVDAWYGNTEGSDAPAIAGGGTIGPKDQVIVRGSWVYDSGHEGYNEVHAVRIVQRVESIPSDPKEFKEFLARWCEKLSEVPRGEPIGTITVGLTPDTAGPATVAQGQPENQWTFHPVIDGCRPDDEPDEPPPILGAPIHGPLGA